MLSPLLVITLALPATGHDTTFELSASGRFSVTGYSSPAEPAFADARALDGGGSLTITGFVKPVIDDDAAPSLQPFLQRAGSFSVFGGGSRSSFTQPAQLGPSRDTSVGNVGVNGYGYLARALFVGAGLSVHYESYQYVGYDTRGNFLSLPFFATLGVRWRELLVNAGWSITPGRFNDDSFTVPFWGGAYLNGYGVIARRASLGAVVEVLQGGADAEVRFSVWTARRLGIGASGGGGHAAPSAPQRAYDFANARVWAAVWMTSRAELSVEYRIAWYRFAATTSPGADALSHIVSLEVTGRPW